MLAQQFARSESSGVRPGGAVCTGYAEVHAPRKARKVRASHRHRTGLARLLGGVISNSRGFSSPRRLVPIDPYPLQRRTFTSTGGTRRWRDGSDLEVGEGAWEQDLLHAIRNSRYTHGHAGTGPLARLLPSPLRGRGSACGTLAARFREGASPPPI